MGRDARSNWEVVQKRQPCDRLLCEMKLFQTPDKLLTELFKHLPGQVVLCVIECAADLRIIVSRLLAGLILIALDAAVLLAEGEGLPVLLLRELELWARVCLPVNSLAAA